MRRYKQQPTECYLVCASEPVARIVDTKLLSVLTAENCAEMDLQNSTEKVVEKLINIYGSCLDREIIRSVAYNCKFQCKDLIIVFLMN